MLTNVSSADYLITGDSIQQKENVKALEKDPQALNIYSKNLELDDSLEISDQAKKLFEREKDIQLFTSMAMDEPLSSEESAKINRLIQESLQEGKFLSNKDLAEILYSNDNFIKDLKTL